MYMQHSHMDFCAHLPTVALAMMQLCTISICALRAVFVGHTLKLPRPHACRPFGGSAADHPLNLGHELIQSERFGHDFHALLHPAVAGNYALGVASKE